MRTEVTEESVGQGRVRKHREVSLVGQRRVSVGRCFTRSQKGQRDNQFGVIIWSGQQLCQTSPFNGQMKNCFIDLLNVDY